MSSSSCSKYLKTLALSVLWHSFPRGPGNGRVNSNIVNDLLPFREECLPMGYLEAHCDRRDEHHLDRKHSWTRLFRHVHWREYHALDCCFLVLVCSSRCHCCRWGRFLFRSFAFNLKLYFLYLMTWRLIHHASTFCFMFSTRSSRMSIFGHHEIVRAAKGSLPRVDCGSSVWSVRCGTHPKQLLTRQLRDVLGWWCW